MNTFLGLMHLRTLMPKITRPTNVYPVYGDFKQGFPPTLSQGGTKEIFLGNFICLYQRIDQVGQTVKLGINEGMPHVFVPTLPETVESKAAIVKVRDWVSKHLLGD